MLVLTEARGYQHRVTRPRRGGPSVVEEALRALLPGLELRFSRDARDLTPEALRALEGVFFFTSGELPLDAAQREALLAFVREGGAFIGCHSAADTLYSWPAYGELLGAYFDRHPWRRRVRIVVEEEHHRATRGLGRSFLLRDEVYQFRAPYDRARTQVLLRLDLDSVWRKGDRADGDYALAWTHSYGAGRVFYTALGHRAAVWRDARFLALLKGGIEDALRLPA